MNAWFLIKTILIGEEKILENPSQDVLQSIIGLNPKGQHLEALKRSSELLQKYPNSVALYKIQANANVGLGLLDPAIKSYKAASILEPNSAEIYYNLGVILQNQGKLREAVDSYGKAVASDPSYADAFYNMGNAFQMQGKVVEALESYNKAIVLKSDFSEAYYNMGNVLKGVRFNKPNHGMQEIITRLLNHKNYVRPRDISLAAISLLKFEPVIGLLTEKDPKKSLESSFKEIVLALSNLPLLLKLMSVSPIADLGLELALTEIRSMFLKTVLETNRDSDFLNLQSALALQCFTNEYIYSQTEADSKILKDLEVIVEKTLSQGEQPSSHFILCLASYKALNEYKWYDLLTIHKDIEEVFVKQVMERKYETLLKSDIPILGEVIDPISLKVREQYEENPYPRWVNLELPFEPAEISEVVNSIKLRLFDNEIKKNQSPNILIAGCGTGQHSIGTATRFKNSRVLAIDLSLSSLAYAKRKTEEFGIENIEYVQGDILNLKKLNKQFDIIESTGVLHHMEEPMLGWQVLTECLKKSGLMKVALYSARGRQDIAKVREEIEALGYETSDIAMKSFRNILINSGTDHYKSILQSRDFFSMSTFRDLLFNVKEHRFTITQIKDCMDKLGLKFCGFEPVNIIEDFKSGFTNANDIYDLDKWDAYEEFNPRTFAGMYQFWCQKVTE